MSQEQVNLINHLAVSPRVAHIPAQILHYMRRAMTINLSVFNASQLCQGNLSISEAEKVFDYLEQMQLGESQMNSISNSRILRYFFRVKFKETKGSFTFTQSIRDLGLNIGAILKNLNECDSKE